MTYALWMSNLRRHTVSQCQTHSDTRLAAPEWIWVRELARFKHESVRLADAGAVRPRKAAADDSVEFVPLVPPAGACTRPFFFAIM